MEPLTLKPLTDESIKRTLFGVVTSLDDLFEAFLYCPEVRIAAFDHSQPHKKTHSTPTPAGSYFFGSEYPLKIKTWMNPPACGGHLVVFMHHKVEMAVQSRCTHGQIGGVRLIPWPNTGHALVLATDRAYIANPWLAFVPLDTIPEINPEVTPVFRQYPEGKTLRTKCGNGRITNHPEWSQVQPWVSYIGGTAGRHFVFPEQAIAYFRGRGMELDLEGEPK